MAGALLRWIALMLLAAAPLEVRAQICGDGTVGTAEECDDGNQAAGDCCSATCTLELDGSACDDGRPCTTDDRCALAVCRGQPLNELCARVNLDYLSCYKAKRAKAPRGATPYPVFEPRLGEQIPDEFRTPTPTDRQQLDLKKPLHACSAALAQASGDSGAPAERTHMEAYLAKPTQTQPEQPKFEKREVGLQSVLGNQVLRLKKPKMVLVPSGMALGDGRASPPEELMARRFKCYKASLVKPKRGVVYANAFEPTTLELSDLLGGSAQYEIGEPKHLCVPEIPELAGATAPLSHLGYLVCHKAKASADAEALVSTLNRYGPEILSTKKLKEICVPAIAWVPRDENAGPFPFLSQKGPVPEAMKTIWEHGQQAPGSSEEKSAAMAEIAAAQDVIRANLSSAQSALLDVLRSLSPDSALPYASLVPLLRLAGDNPEILGHLHGVLMTDFGLAGATHPHDVPPDELVRRTLMDLLMHHADRGSALAEGLILDSVASPHLDTRKSAIRCYYALKPDRRMAQREMRARLDPATRYLLYVE